jgi:hypothetical protein
LTAGCATILEGDGQVISVNNFPTGATCTFNRDGQIIGAISSTPGSLAVDKSRKTIVVTCEKSGYPPVVGSDVSHADGAIYANILFGGLIGLLVNLATGADHYYGSTINVTFPPPDTRSTLSDNIPRS